MNRQARRTWRLCGGVLLLLCGVFGLRAASNASLAHAAYYRARYGSARSEPVVIARLCETSHRKYPFNYRLCAWTARAAWDAHRDAADPRLASAARDWCDIALALNPFYRPAHVLKVEQLAAESPGAALAHWTRYVDWHYWDPRNHAILLGLQADARDFEGATRTRALLDDTRYADWARDRLARAWAAEREPPPLPSP